MEKIKKIRAYLQDPYETKILFNDIKNLFVTIVRIAIIVGVSYVILSPLIGMFVNAISSTKDAYNPMVFVIPEFPTLERFQLAFTRLDYLPTMARDLAYTITTTLVQLLICSMVGYGFARFEFPFKKFLFACVVVMIVIPTHTIMLPLYLTFRSFDPLGLMTLIKGAPLNLMGTVAPMYIMSFLGCGVRSGLYIYIFNQFFRGLPKEIEEAAFVDGAGMWYTYFRIMLVNAMPSVITVAIFSMVWQYNDTFYASLFAINNKTFVSTRISTITSNISNVEKILDPNILQLFLDAGIVLVMLPVIIVYVALQKQFIEGVERSGIVG